MEIQELKTIIKESVQDEFNESLKLDLTDSKAFIDSLINPLLPNEALKVAAVNYQQTFPNS